MVGMEEQEGGSRRESKLSGQDGDLILAGFGPERQKNHAREDQRHIDE